MPLMQLSTLVLPAPFGPISARSSPGAAANDTSSRTTSPPNRRVRRSTASSAIPPPAPAILLDVAIAPARACAAAEVELLHVGMPAQAFGGAVEYDAAVLHDVAVIGDRERDRRALLDQQDGEIELAPDLHEALRQVIDHDRRESKRQFVDQQQLGPAYQRAAERQRLPLAARQQAGEPAA